MVNNSNIYLLVGNIGSGKSTWTRKNKDLGIVISRDYFRYMFGSDFYIYKEELEPIIKNIEQFTIELLMQNKHNIIIDEVGINKNERKQYINLAKQYNYKVIAIVLTKLSKEQSLINRMNHDSRGYTKEEWANVWEKFDKMYENPDLNEGIDLINFI